MKEEKKIVITNYKEFGDQPEKKTLVVFGDEGMDAQDGYHSFTELYEHRILLWITCCYMALANRQEVWKSINHSDGSTYAGWFVLGMNSEAGKQITYHVPVKYWDDCYFAKTLDKAPEFDGHTSNDVLERLKALV